MAVRTAYAPVAATVLTAANLARLPGGWIGYAEVTANQTTITTTVDLTGLTVTVTVGTSRRLRITGQAQAFSTVANDTVVLTIVEGATDFNTGAVTPPLANVGWGIVVHHVITPTSGAHTYKLRMGRATGTGNVTMQAGATAPAFILVEDIGPAS